MNEFLHAPQTGDFTLQGKCPTSPFVRRRKARHAAGRAARYAIEQLESRTLLSIAAAVVAGPWNVPGTQWTYQYTIKGKLQSATDTETVFGPVMFQGVSVIERDSSLGSNLKSYFGVDASGNFLNYGTSSVVAGSTQMDVYSPPRLLAPALIYAGTAYGGPSTDTFTDKNSNGDVTATSTGTFSNVVTLKSETPVSITVPANSSNTYQAYDFTDVETTVDSVGTTGTSNIEDWFAPNVGLVKEVSITTSVASDGTTTGPSTTTIELTRFGTAADHLTFTVQPSNGTTDEAIKPPVTVAIDDFSGNVDAKATDAITLTVTPGGTGTGSLSGTATQSAVGGIATFSGLSINQAGKYTFMATSDNSSTMTTPIASNPFTIGDDHLVVRKQPPANVDVLKPFSLTVELVNKKDMVDTTENTAQAQLSLEIIRDGQGAQLQGTTTLTFVNGKADFAPSDIVSFTSTGPSITGVGTFKLMVSEIGPDASASSIETNEIKTAGYHFHLKYVEHPTVFPVAPPAAIAEPGEPLLATGDDIQPGATFRIELLDKQGNAVTSVDAPNLTESLTPVQGDGQIVGDTTVAMNNQNEYHPSADVTSAGQYTFQFSAVDTPGVNTPGAAVAPLTFGPVQVVNPRLHANTLKFEVANKNFAHLGAGLVTGTNAELEFLANPSPSAGVALSLSSDTASGHLIGNTAFVLPTENPSGERNSNPAVSISEAGQYTLTYTEVVTPNGQPFDPNNFAPEPDRATVVQTIVVRPDKIAFLPQPPHRLTVSQPFSVSVVLTDSQGNVLSSFDNSPSEGQVAAVSLTATTSGSGGGGDLQNVAPVAFANGVATFSNLFFSASGGYILHAQFGSLTADGSFSSSDSDPRTVSLFIRVTGG